MSMKIVSVNIEGRKHLKTVRRFLVKEKAEVVCLMEVYREDVLMIAEEEYPFVVFAANDVMGNIVDSKGLEQIGVAILSRTVMIDVEKDNLGEKPKTKVVDVKMGTHAPVILTAKIGDYQIGVTHFTWSKKGEVSQEQRNHLDKMLKKLESIGELVLCGDFNIPRGNELYKKIAEKYQDNIPMEVISTLDPELHYANKKEKGKLKSVVDYVWSSPKYKVKNVRVESGVSDHCGVICEIVKLI